MHSDCKQSNPPKISIVTATYNQGNFIEETFQSLLSQNYPNLEYIVIDGGSTDQTLSVMGRFEKLMNYWVSEPDDGAADAIEKGRRRCSGELFNWLNSDDYLLPGTLISLGAIATRYPDFDVYAFLGMGTGPNGLPLMAWSGTWPNQRFHLIAATSIFAQESTFVRAKFLAENDICVRKEYSHLFDTMLYEETLAKRARVLFIDVFGGVIRHHAAARTSLGVPQRDFDLVKTWEKRNLGVRMRSFRRLGATRLHSTLKAICGQATSARVLCWLLGRPHQSFCVCRLTAWQIREPESWTLYCY